MRDVLIGQTDYSTFVKIANSSGPVTGLVYTDIDISYSRVETDNDVTVSDVTPATLANITAAHSDWGFIEIDSANHPGLYRIDHADAVFATGAWEACVTITDASGSDFPAVDIGFRLVAFNPLDGVRLGLTALPNHTGLALAANCIGYGTADSGATTTSIPVKTLNISLDDVDQLLGRVVIFPTSAGTGMKLQACLIEGVTLAPDTLAVSQLTSAPSEDDPFIIQ